MMDIDAEPAQKGRFQLSFRESLFKIIHLLSFPTHQAYAWESEYKRGWELEEDESGQLLIPLNKKKQKFLNSKRGQSAKVHRGLIRNIVLVVDASRMMSGMCLSAEREEVNSGIYDDQ
jgi:hypothetical protein